MSQFINNLRDFSSKPLNLNQLNQDPVEQFDNWFKQAEKKEVYEFNAFVLGTSGKDNRPSTRFLLLKTYNKKGFIFFTNYESRKSMQLEENPLASMAFFWPVMQRQVRIEGKTEVLTDAESDKYFHLRSEASKIGAWASPQSKPIPSREYLENLKNEYEQKYRQFRTPRPPYWGGYRLIPDRVEFWQGQPNRLHDRFEYVLKNGQWFKERLAP